MHWCRLNDNHSLEYYNERLSGYKSFSKNDYQQKTLTKLQSSQPRHVCEMFQKICPSICHEIVHRILFM